MAKIVLWGATGQAKVLREALEGSGIDIVAIVDSRQLVSPIAGVPILIGEAGLDAWLVKHEAPATLLFAIAVGGASGTDRLKLYDLVQRRGLSAYTVVHRTAFVAADAQLGEGCQVLAKAAVCTHAKLGKVVIVNTAASVDHDCIVGDGVHVAPGARLAGEVSIGARAFVGIGAVVLPRLHVGEDAIVGAGAVVTRDVSAGATVVGNPARVLRDVPGR
ncbi:MAG: sugar acetyltransferase [Betaproteobacteria bacterium 13_1_40CM_4_64_4]|nr:MAG: sugar acetyltransferase [Betaproteobacteria bacterium 13_1_40CM_4_64_4]